MSVLDNFLKTKRADLSKMKKEFRKLQKEKGRDNEKNALEREIEDLEVLIRRFMKSRMEPAKVGHIVINNKVLERFLKKLNGMHYVAHVSGKSLLLEYGKRPEQWTGSLELYDLTSHFEGYGEIKKEVELHEQYEQ